MICYSSLFLKTLAKGERTVMIEMVRVNGIYISVEVLKRQNCRIKMYQKK